MKKFLLGVIALFAIVIAGSAFIMPLKNEEKGSKAKTGYFYFYLDSNSSGDENDPDKWVFDDETAPSTSCGGFQVLCTVKAPAVWNGTEYVIDESLLSTPINMRSDPEISEREFKPGQ